MSDSRLSLIIFQSIIKIKIKKKKKKKKKKKNFIEWKYFAVNYYFFFFTNKIHIKNLRTFYP